MNELIKAKLEESKTLMEKAIERCDNDLSKIRAGKAEELSEGDTLYLGACTKGSTAASSYRSQPYSTGLAKQRAFSLKSKYLNFIIDDSLGQDSEPVIKSSADYKQGQLSGIINKIANKALSDAQKIDSINGEKIFKKYKKLGLVG